MIYGPGAAINLYQVLLDCNINVGYKTVSSQAYKVTEENTVHYDASDSVYFPFDRDKQVIKSKNPFKRRKGAAHSDSKYNFYTELMSMMREQFLEACSLYPKSAKLLQDLAIEQVEFLSEVRNKRDHLHPGNDVNY